MNATHINRYVRCISCGAQSDEIFFHETKWGFVCDDECLKLICIQQGVLLKDADEEVRS